MSDAKRLKMKPLPQRHQVTLRLEPELHLRLQRMAHRELRSLNQQIEYLLRQVTAPEEAHD